MSENLHALRRAPKDLVMPAHDPMKQAARTERLLRWLERAGDTPPTLLELEQERDRRDRDRYIKRVMRKHWDARDERGAGS